MIIPSWLVTIFFLGLLKSVQSIRILPSEATHRQQQQRIHREDQPDGHNDNTTGRRRSVMDNVHVDIPTDPAGHLVQNLPLLEPGSFVTAHWAGHLPASSGGDKYFFYWLFAPDLSSSSSSSSTTVADADIPLIVWLNGGPACSSMDGLFIENGPFRLQKDSSSNQYKLVTDPYSWHKLPAYVVYIDQPVGTGLSFTTSGLYPTNDEQVNTDFYYFLQAFFQLHADKFVRANKNNDQEAWRRLYFSGESYAGHFIPSLVNYLLQKNNSIDKKNRQIIIPVAGAAIGNGWTDPYYQYDGSQFAYGEGLIGFAALYKYAEKERECQQQLNAGHYSVAICFDLIDDILHESHGGTSITKASGYDVRKSESKHGPRIFPPGHEIIETYLGGWPLPSHRDDIDGILDGSIYTQVLEAIHASAATVAGQRYRECTDPPYNALAGNDGKGVVDDVVDVLDHPSQIRLLFFNGIHDIVCNHVGNERFLWQLPWKHREDWTLASRYAWLWEKEVVGYMQEFQNLQFLKIMDAGHMVPMDVPNVAMEMMKLFVYQGSFDSSLQALDLAAEDNSKSCPVCPTCSERDSGGTKSENPPTSNGSTTTSNGATIIRTTWLAAGFAFVVFLVGVFMVRSRRGSISSHNDMRMVPQYDIELRDTSDNGFRDRSPTNGFTDDVDRNRVL